MCNRCAPPNAADIKRNELNANISDKAHSAYEHVIYFHSIFVFSTSRVFVILRWLQNKKSIASSIILSLLFWCFLKHSGCTSTSIIVPIAPGQMAPLFFHTLFFQTHFVSIISPLRSHNHSALCDVKQKKTTYMYIS